MTTLLNSRLIYGSDDYLCFEPGIAFRFGEGLAATDALVCLHCRKVLFFHKGAEEYMDLNPVGVERIRSIYGQLFPGHTVDGPNPDADRVAAQRDQERERREALLFKWVPQPSTRPAQ